MQRASSIVVVLTVALSVGCRDTVAGPGSGPPITHIRLIPFAAWLHPGDTLRLDALPFDADGRRIERHVRFAWVSTRPEVASVDSTGLVTAVGIGDAELEAAAEGVHATSLVHVLAEPFTPAGFDEIVAGNEFTCAVEPLGVAFCWGRNTDGQLGNGGEPGGAVPVPVTNLARVEELVAGTRHACVIDADGQPWCWGWNSVRQVGPWFEHKIAAVPVPAPVEGRFVDIAAGSGHTCVLRDDGAAVCWGANPLGQIGVDASSAAGPVPVAGLPPLTALVAGHAHTCGLDTDGDVWCWGWDADGQLGAATTGVCPDGNPCSAVPLRVRTAVRFRALAAGSLFTCGLDDSGAAWCWGSNALGQLGNGRGGTSVEPVRVDGPPFVELRAGREHACGLTAAGVLYCWGDNRHGQLGDGTGEDPLAPVVATQAPARTIDFAPGGAHTCAVGEGGEAICWGSNGSGQLGLNPAS